MSAPPRILVIAGSDSSGGAGIQADIKTVTMLSAYAMTAITAVTAQNTTGVSAIAALSTDLVEAQIDACLDDIGADAVKIGMLGSAEIAHRVADRLEPLDLPVVFDPVMVATSGAVLAEEATIAAFTRLMQLAAVTTPNLPELAALAGHALGADADTADAAAALIGRGARAVLAKGGHRDTDGPVLDWLYAPSPEGPTRAWRFEHPRIATRHTHGTGCTLASAIAVGLGQGLDLPAAVRQARAFVRAALLAAPGFGAGHGPMGHQAVRTLPAS